MFGGSNEIREDCLLDCRRVRRAGAYAVVLHVRHDRPPGPATHHASPVLLRLRERGNGVAVRIFCDRYGPRALPADDDCLRARKSELRSLRRALSAEAPGAATVDDRWPRRAVGLAFSRCVLQNKG